MSKCSGIRSQFSEYLDGSLTGVAMQKIAAHLETCPRCSEEFGRWRNAQHMLADLGPAKAPPELALRLRVAVSQEKTHSARQNLARWQMRWQNSVSPFLLQASAGLVSAILLVGTMGLLVGAPEPASAGDQPLGEASNPHFLYSNLAAAPTSIGDRDNPVVVEAYVDGSGRVYDYQIVSGPSDPRTRSQVENQLLFSVFAPARFFGQPVRGLVVLSFSGVSVQG
jgi:anti-sigma factor RsiW